MIRVQMIRQDMRHGPRMPVQPQLTPRTAPTPPGERSRLYGALLAADPGGGVMTKKKPAPKKRKAGRPSLYTEMLAAEICRHIDRPICNRRRKPCPF